MAGSKAATTSSVDMTKN
jgi:hypothetical protein